MLEAQIAYYDRTQVSNVEDLRRVKESVEKGIVYARMQGTEKTFNELSKMSTLLEGEIN